MTRRDRRALLLVLYAGFALMATSTVSWAQTSSQQCNPNTTCCSATGTYAGAGSQCTTTTGQTGLCNYTGSCIVLNCDPSMNSCCTSPTTVLPVGSPCVDPANNQTSVCNNGTVCTGNPGACSDGSCHPVAQAGHCGPLGGCILDIPCTDGGTRDPDTGACIPAAPPSQCDPNGQSGGCCTSDGKLAPAGSPCNDGNPRTVDSCNATGVCVGQYPPDPGCAPPATYNPQTGACSYSGSTPKCGDGVVGNGEQCDNGSQCANGTDCTGNPTICGDNSCRPRGGNCCTSSCTFASSGTTCNDGNGCTTTDSCDGNGVCVGSGQVSCDGSDACHPTNFCSPATGSCGTCRNPNDAQDLSYCSLESGQCVAKEAACPEFATAADGTVNLCQRNNGRDPNTGQCLYDPTVCIPTGCLNQACDPTNGQCKIVRNDPRDLFTCGGSNSVCTPPPNGCPADNCSYFVCDPSVSSQNCATFIPVNCYASNPYPSCQTPKAFNTTLGITEFGCQVGMGCVYDTIECQLPADPCQEAVRNPNAAGCCTYQPRDCAAEFGNDPNYTYTCDPTPATGGCRALQKQTITLSPIANQVVGTTVILVASATSQLPVTFASLTPAVCSVSGARATLLTIGTCTIQASQAGNNKYTAATPINQSFNVVGAQTQTITFASIPAQVQGAKVNLAASASSSLAVNFATLTPAICSVSGSTATMLAAGTCSIQASQPGNGVYLAATPVVQSFAVTSFSLTAKPASETITRGQLAAFLLVLQSINGFKGSVAVTCAGGPANSACAGFPKSVTLNGTAYAVSGVLFPKQTASGTYVITFTAVSGPLTQKTTATFTVK